MDAGADRSKPKIDLSTLQMGGNYRVDWKHERLRRTFRCKGTLSSIEQTTSTGPDGRPQIWLAFDVKPRFGKAAVQRVDAATITMIEPA